MILFKLNVNEAESDACGPKAIQFL